MSQKGKVLDIAKKNTHILTIDIAKKLKISRQRAHTIVKELVNQKELIKFGTTVNAFYTLPKNVKKIIDSVTKNLKNKDLQEHDVLQALEKKSPVLSFLQDNVRSIFDYAFSEMLNNAIEHSLSKNIRIEIEKDAHLVFHVDDTGIGVFYSILKNKNLDSELEAIQELLKGKTTTMPHAHSGEGIFFTSKIADYFSLQSHHHELIVDNINNDVTVVPLKRAKQGTKVYFKIALNSQKHLNDIFVKYQSNPEEYVFDKTDILVKLYTMGSVHVSRSQARRILSNLDKFKVVTLDFDKVPNIGQAFADEIFRVFPQKHPQVRIIPVNMNETVNFMIERAIKTER